METRWLYRTSEDFVHLRDAAAQTCVIPMGCVEKHGLHLPLGTDIIKGSHIAYMASQIEPVCIFPDFTFGRQAAGGSPMVPLGTVSLTVETQMLLLEELCDQIGKNGFKKIAIFNSHGGNDAWLRTFLQKIADKKTDYVVTVIRNRLLAPHGLAEHILQNGPESVPEMNEEDIALVLKYHAENMRNGHACFGETAYIMGIDPSLARLDRLGIESGLSTGLPDYLEEAGIYITDGGWSQKFPNSYDGHDPIGCNERIGKAALRVEAERVAHAYKVLKEDENLLKWHHQAQDGWDVKPRK